MKIFAMYDKKANFYMQPFPEQSTISALRGFEVAVNNSESIFKRFPDDFELVELAFFDQSSGEIICHQQPVSLGTARSVLKSFQQDLTGEKNLTGEKLASVQ